MATLEEIYAKIVSDDAEKKAFVEAFATEEGAAAFMAQRGCEARPAELVALMREKAAAAGELSDEDLDNAAGGAWTEWLMSIGSFGIACAAIAIYSVCTDKDALDPEERRIRHETAPVLCPLY